MFVPHLLQRIQRTRFGPLDSFIPRPFHKRFEIRRSYPTVHPMSSHKEKFESALSSLKKEHLRITEPRKALLQLLVDSKTPRSAEEIHTALGASQYDLVTVYRNMEAFEKAGIVNRMPTESGKSLYELNEESHHYHHIICRKCHRAEKLDICEMEKLEKLASNLGYSEFTHVLELYGVCEDCR